MTVALLMKACATAWPTASIILLSRWASVNGWKDGRLNFLITSPDLLMLYDLRHSSLNFFIFLLLFFFELIFRNRNLVFFTNCRFICEFHHVETFVSHRACQKMCGRKNQHTGIRGQVIAESRKNQPSVPINLTWNWQGRKQSQIRERISWDSEYLSRRCIGRLCR